MLRFPKNCPLSNIFFSSCRIFVHEDIIEEFTDRLVAETKRLVVGDPLEKETFMGALISEAHREKVISYIRLAREDGGSVLTGETVTKLKLPSELREGYYCQPTVITGLPDDSRCMQEEIFGPVTCIATPFSTEEEAIRRANDVKYGLCASVWSENMGIIHRCVEYL